MKKYNYEWRTKSICVWEEGKQIDSIASPYNDYDSNFLEICFDDGNFIMSNRCSGTGSLTYQHYSIRETDQGYTILKGKKWADGMWRSFKKIEDGILEVELCYDRSITFYDCTSFEEYEKREKPVVLQKSQK